MKHLCHGIKSLILLLFCFFIQEIKAQDEEIRFQFKGFTDSYHALRSQNPNDFMSSRSRLRTEVQAEKGNANMFVSMNAIHNSILNDKTGFFLREAYFRYAFDKWELKAGRQIITWGVADGLRITDLVSPMDYTEFLAQDYDDIRIPENGFRLRYSHDKFNLEGIFVPVPEVFQLPVDTENPWSVISSISIPYSLDMNDKPGKRLSNAEIGGRFSIFRSGVDFSISGLHTWNKMPVINTWQTPGTDSLYMKAHYERMDMLGFDFSIPVGKLVVRAEAATYRGELQDIGMQAAKNIILRKNSYNSLIGIDWYPGNDWTIMIQYSHKYIADYDNRITSKRNTGLATLNLSKKVLLTMLALSSFTYYDVTYGSLYNRSSVDYTLTDQIHLMCGYDWFHGDNGMFAMYKNNSEYWVKVKYSF